MSLWDNIVFIGTTNRINLWVIKKMFLRKRCFNKFMKFADIIGNR